MWLSGEIILSDLSLRIRPDFETSRGLCGLAQNSAHRVPATTNVLRRLRPHQTHPHLQSSAGVRIGTGQFQTTPTTFQSATAVPADCVPIQTHHTRQSNEKFRISDSAQ
ncbi:hypothetical protein [Lapidilactobacillus salsurivasis]